METEADYDAVAKDIETALSCKPTERERIEDPLITAALTMEERERQIREDCKAASVKEIVPDVPYLLCVITDLREEIAALSSEPTGRERLDLAFPHGDILTVLDRYDRGEIGRGGCAAEIRRICTPEPTRPEKEEIK